ncbi:MAG TPA: methanogenesis marker 2 protein [Methanocella sp.]|nr:methanogenesis marker 2 protein [Methanocella sp.]
MTKVNMLEELARSLGNYAGTTRKHAIKAIVSIFDPEGINPSFGEDAAILDFGDECLLLAADGIWDWLMQADPEWSGYCAVLANVHDVYAMGGRPIAMVDVFSSCSEEVGAKVLRGLRSGIDKFGVPIVGGHTHPDTPYAALDIAILGRVKKDCIIYSSEARPDNAVVLAIDLDGRVHPSCDLNWDSTLHKDAAIVKDQAASMIELGEKKLLTAGKDVSNPGILGTLGMILEVSGVGAQVELSRIPKPPDIEYQRWLRMYPGMGFIVTCRPENNRAVLEVFEKHGLPAAQIGTIMSPQRLDLLDGQDRTTLFDFRTDGITGLKPLRGCQLRP